MLNSIKRRSLPRQTKLRLYQGRKLGKYRLLKRLGKGGYGEVWKARDQVEGIWVALKIPQPGRDGRWDNHSLLREIRMVAQLRHPHIMPVKNADLIDGYAVLATDLSTGTLDDKSRPMTPRRIIPIIDQVLDGLAYAHRHHLVHCDVTPGNIFLFADGRAALGDFGISQPYRRSMVTMEEFGTPGYVAPDQAYGKPTYSSDCFSVALILYEYLTGYLPRWPFVWPATGHSRLRERTNAAMVRLLKKALTIDPRERFANATQMRQALHHAAEKILHPDAPSPRNGNVDWRRQRRETFVKRYRKVFPGLHPCRDCGEPVAEAMQICPWCSSGRNHFESTTVWSHFCHRCKRGVLPEWHYCPWCYGPGFASPTEKRTRSVHYVGSCSSCRGKLMAFMRYCPWCRYKVKRPWQVHPFPETCGNCRCSVDSDYWLFCPWCEDRLIG